MEIILPYFLERQSKKEVSKSKSRIDSNSLIFPKSLFCSRGMHKNLLMFYAILNKLPKKPLNSLSLFNTINFFLKVSNKTTSPFLPCRLHREHEYMYMMDMKNDVPSFIVMMLFVYYGSSSTSSSVGDFIYLNILFFVCNMTI